MEWFNDLSPSHAAFLGALIAGVLAFFGTMASLAFYNRKMRYDHNHQSRLQKQDLTVQGSLKLSDYRHEWMEKLRLTISDVLTMIDHHAQGKKGFDEAYSQHIDYLQLLLNPYGDREQALMHSLERYRRLVIKKKHEKAAKLRDDILAASRLLLKQEWERIKQDLALPSEE
jgi:hypothetical protein